MFVPLLCLVALTSLQAPASITARLEKTLAVPTLRPGTVGMRVVSLDTGKLLFERNPEKSLMPASNMKIVTCSAALALLGPSFTYTTSVYSLGDDLILKGSGDPSLDFARLKKLAEAVKAAGVTELKGKLLYDASVFDAEALGEGWQWDDEEFYYSAQVSGLSCDENVALVLVKPGAVGQPPLVEAIPYLTIENKAVTTDGKEQALKISRKRGQNVMVISGKLGDKSDAKRTTITMEDPARFAAFRFAEALRAVGVSVPEHVVLEPDIASPQSAPFVISVSKPLSQLAADFMKPSDNLFGECFLKTLGAVKGKKGTTAEGAKVVREWLKSRNIPTVGFYQADGSGLSRMNLVTAQLLLGILRDRAGDADLRAAMPVGGVDGTLKNRFKNTPAQNNVRAKTGTLTGASSLSGYVTSKAGERLVFSILMNHYDREGGASTARALQDALVLTLVDMPRKR
ncbi:D-alanyl-D-alanine carboxypeptidase/D-alanyl-D-alanine-endopeptidase [Armatimonas sp.]|uniref:D-alanyl-D-alanine carboxypeptidase/D-alanyl-D-alanine endopeptidase n=1 Tax=Armatimonas sp. TaxID=1872638 RepID=UPI003750223C